MNTAKPENIDAYIAAFPENVRKVLEQIRFVIIKAAPGAEEVISYGMPAFKYKGRVIIYFGGYKNHIGLYATPSGHAAFKKELSGYKQGKGSVQFPLNKPIPFNLISEIVKFNLKQREVKQTELFGELPAPVRRALDSNGIKTLQQLAKNTKAEILQLHGVGKTALPKLESLLEEKGLGFKNEKILGK